ncbi:hypothetical protein ACFWFI_30655 [Streptomyces sp. NPDC060209]
MHGIRPTAYGLRDRSKSSPNEFSDSAEATYGIELPDADAKCT